MVRANTNNGGRLRRGVALMLVMIAVIVSSIVAYSYLAGQSTSMGIARNINAHSRARYIAETGLDLTLAAVKADPAWRSTYSQGTWTANAPLLGGFVTVVAQDGRDTNGDGIISIPSEGDGSLSDDPADIFTLTVTGRMSVATHVVRAIGIPTNAATQKVGITSPLPDSVRNVENRQIATLVTVPQEGSITGLAIYGDGPPPKQLRLAVYSDSGGEPGNLLAQTSAVGIASNTPQWETVTLNPPLAVEPGQYWLAFGYEHSNMYYYYGAGGGQTRFRNNDAVANGFTPTWGASASTDTRRISLYAIMSGDDYSIDWQN